MADPRPATSAEEKAFKRLCWFDRIGQIELKVCEAVKNQIVIANTFANDRGLSLAISEADSQEYNLGVKQQHRLNRIMQGVRSGVLSLHFPNGINGDIQVVGFPGMNDDERAYYSELGAILVTGIVTVLVLGAAAGLGAWAYIRNQTSKVSALQERLIATREAANSKFCANPNDPICNEWLQFRREAGYEHEADMIETFKSEMSELSEKLEKPVSIGLSWGIPIVALVFGVWFLRGRS